MTQTNQPRRALELSCDMRDAIAPLLVRIRKHGRSLADPLRRAAQSVTLNLAESAGHRDGNRRLRQESAIGGQLRAPTPYTEYLTRLTPWRPAGGERRPAVEPTPHMRGRP